MRSQRFAEFEIVAKALGDLFVGFGPRADELAGAVENLAEPLPQIGPLAEAFGQDVAHAQQRVGGAGDAPVGIDEVDRPGVQVGAARRGLDHFVGQRLEAPLAGHGGQGLFLRFERQVQIFQPLGAFGGLDLGGQLGGQFSLRFDRPQDRLLALGQQPHFDQPRLDLANLLLVQAAGLILAIAGDERHCVASIEQFDDGLDLAERELESLRHRPQVDGDCVGATHAEFTCGGVDWRKCLTAFDLAPWQSSAWRRHCQGSASLSDGRSSPIYPTNPHRACDRRRGPYRCHEVAEKKRKLRTNESNPQHSFCRYQCARAGVDSMTCMRGRAKSLDTDGFDGGSTRTQT